MSKKQGVLSLWVFRDKPEDLDESLLEDEFGIDDYNEDLLEMGGSDTWDEVPLGEVLSTMSVSETWANQAIEKAKELGITKCRRAFVIANFAYDPKLASDLPADPVFIGVFDFRY